MKAANLFHGSKDAFLRFLLNLLWLLKVRSLELVLSFWINTLIAGSVQAICGTTIAPKIT